MVINYQAHTSALSGSKTRTQEKLVEHTYKSEYHTKQKLKKVMKGNNYVTLATDDGVYHLMPPPIDFNTNP